MEPSENIQKSKIEYISLVFIVVSLLFSCKDKKSQNINYDSLIDETIILVKENRFEYPPFPLISHTMNDVSKYPLIEAGKPALGVIRKRFTELTDKNVKSYFLLSMFYIGESEINQEALLVLRNETDEDLFRIASAGLSLYGTKEILPELVDIIEKGKQTNGFYTLSTAESITGVHLSVDKLTELSEDERFEKRKVHFLEWWDKNRKN